MWEWGAGGCDASLWLILFPLAAAVMLAWIWRSGTPSQPRRKGQPSATEIDDARYASGELDALDVAGTWREPAEYGHGS